MVWSPQLNQLHAVHAQAIVDRLREIPQDSSSLPSLVQNDVQPPLFVSSLLLVVH